MKKRGIHIVLLMLPINFQNRTLRLNFFFDELGRFVLTVSAKRGPTSSPALRHRSSFVSKSLNSRSATWHFNAARSSVVSRYALGTVSTWQPWESLRPK